MPKRSSWTILEDKTMEKPLNVLFIAGGRRVSLAEAFIKRGFNVFAYELGHETPISKVAEKVFIGSGEWDQQEYQYIEQQKKYHHIDLVIPLSCRATLFCAEYKMGNFQPSYRASTFAYNKLLLEKELIISEYLSKYWPIPIGYPRIYKPINGYGSRGIEIRKSWWVDDLIKNQAYVCQKYVTGPEYSVDAYFDRFGFMVGAVPRTRQRVADGEVLDSRTVNRPELIEATREIGQFLGFKGPTCFQYILDKDDGQKPKLLEINGRFGGGATLSLEAGFDMIKMLRLEYIEGQTLNKNDYKWTPYLSMHRSYQDHFFRG